MSRWNKFNPNRRAFLGGAAAMIGLPFLPSIARADGVAPLRLIYWYVPNGIRMDKFVPIDTGTAYTPSELMAPLMPLRDKLLLLSNVAQARGQDNVAGDHARGTAAFLTARRATRPGVAIQLGESVDYLASQSTRADGTAFRSLHLAAQASASAGSCDSGYPCAYQNTITWANATTPVATRTSAVDTFNQLFVGSNPLATQAALQRRQERRTSVLDYVHAEANTLSNRLSAADQQKVDQYLTGVRELEIRLTANPPGNGTPVCDPGVLEPNSSSGYPDTVDQFIDVMVKAVECDSTRVMSFMADRSGSFRSFGFAGIPEAHHEMSHWAVGTQAEQTHRLDQWQAINAWHMGRFYDFISRLDAITDVDGSTLLDNCMIYFSSEIGDGNSHSHVDMPVLLAGGGCGMVDTGKHVRYGTRQPLANLFRGMLSRFDVPVTSFGEDSTADDLPDVFL